MIYIYIYIDVGDSIKHCVGLYDSIRE